MPESKREFLPTRKIPLKPTINNYISQKINEKVGNTIPELDLSDMVAEQARTTTRLSS